MSISAEYHVYVAKVGEEVIYVGSGKDRRFEHVTSGKSHSSGLNFLVRSGIVADVVVVKENLTKIEARVHEQDLIDLYKPAFNVGIAANKTTRDSVEKLAAVLKETELANPSRYVLSLGRLLFHSANINESHQLVQMAFELSRAKEGGTIVYTESQLKSFISKKASNFENNPHYRQPSELISKEKVYRTSVEDILAWLPDDFYADDWGAHLRGILRSYDKARDSVLLEKDQLQLF